VVVERGSEPGKTQSRDDICCIALQNTATHCNTLQHTACRVATRAHPFNRRHVRHMNELSRTYETTHVTPHTACVCVCVWWGFPHRWNSRIYSMHVWYCSTLQRTTTHCNTLQHVSTHCDTLQHNTTIKVVDVFDVCLICSLAGFFLTKTKWPLHFASTGWRRCQDDLSCRSLSAKKPLISGLFCGKWPDAWWRGADAAARHQGQTKPGWKKIGGVIWGFIHYTIRGLPDSGIYLDKLPVIPPDF